MAYVIDPSVALAWLLPDETNVRANTIRQAVENGAEAWIPAHWWLEIGNGLLMAERRGRIAAEQVALALTLLDALPFKKDDHTAEKLAASTFPLARKHGLTVYDAAYLELARRRVATLATFDAQLVKAAEDAKVPTDHGAKWR